MKRFMAVLLAAVVAATLTSVAVNRKPAPERALRTTLDALQSGDLFKAEGYITGGSLGSKWKTRRLKTFYRIMFSTIRYTITDVQVEGSTADITVLVTMVDMDTLIRDASLSLFQKNLKGDKKTEEAFYNRIIADIQSGAVEYVSRTATAHLTRSYGRWRVYLPHGGFAAAITGGAPSLIGF